MIVNGTQRFSGVVQMAYIVQDIHAAMQEYQTNLKAGPWFYNNSYELDNAIYKGDRTSLSLSIAIGFTGHLSIELIQQNDDTDSVYKDVIDTKGYGFHHWGIATRDIDNDIEAYCAQGCRVVFTGVSPRGIRLAYLDTNGKLPGMLELIEFNDVQEAYYSSMYEASVGWDKRDPVRPM